MQKELGETNNVIIALRRDLAGAKARLSDVTGELSEAQKEELERDKVRLLSQDKELLEAREQLKKLSQIVDQQKSEITALNDDLR